MWALSRRSLSELGLPPAQPHASPRSGRSPVAHARADPGEQVHPSAREHDPLGRIEVLVAGQFPAAPRVAIVGARAATRRALETVPQLVAAARATGHAVLSGGARGVDGDVHLAALRSDVRQGIVLPLHVATPYPPEHEGLFHDVVARGDAVVCPLHEGTVPGRWAFVARNRWLVALASRVVVVEAALRSGSVQTGRLALEMGRPVAAFAGSPGGDALIAHGAACLGHVADANEPESHARVTSFFAGAVGIEDGAVWPPHLADLAARVGEGGAFTLEDVGLACFAAVLDAERRGLLVRVDATRWARVGAGQGAAGVGSVEPALASSKAPKP